MAITFINAASQAAAGSGTSSTANATLNVAAGDILVGWHSWEDGAGGTIGISDGVSNVLTATDVQSDTHSYAEFFYSLNATANASASFVFTNSTARAYRTSYILQFRPDSAGGTIFDAGPSPGNGTGTTLTSGQISPDGTDIMVIAAGKSYISQGWTNRVIGGGAADGEVTNQDITSVWYRHFSSSQSDISGSITGNNSDFWIANIVAFSYSGGASPISINYMRA